MTVDVPGVGVGNLILPNPLVSEVMDTISLMSVLSVTASPVKNVDLVVWYADVISSGRDEVPDVMSSRPLVILSKSPSFVDIVGLVVWYTVLISKGVLESPEAVALV